jgi:inner membrane transporter RhtA
MLGVALAGMTVCFFEAVRRVPLGLATTVAFLGPLAVATLGSRRLVDLGMAALAAFGITLLVRPYAAGWLVDPVGLAFAVSAALCWAGYILLTKRVGAAFPGLQGLAISLAVAALSVTPLGLAGFSAWPQPSQVAAAAGLAILAPVLPCGLEMIALRRMSARPFGILMSLEPAIGVAIGYLLLHQQPNDAQLLGVLCVIAASAGAVMATARPRPAELHAAAPVVPLPPARST